MKLEIEFSERTSYKWFGPSQLSRRLIQVIESQMDVTIRHAGFATYETLAKQLGIPMGLRYLTCGWRYGDTFKINVKDKDDYLMLEIECREDIRND